MVSKTETSECEFCGKTFKVDELEATSFCGLYCRHCLELMIFEAEQAVEAIKERTE